MPSPTAGAPSTLGLASVADQLEILRLTASRDYASLMSGEPQRISAALLVAQWRESLDGMHAQQALIANHVIG